MRGHPGRVSSSYSSAVSSLPMLTGWKVMAGEAPKSNTVDIMEYSMEDYMKQGPPNKCKALCCRYHRELMRQPQAVASPGFPSHPGPHF